MEGSSPTKVTLAEAITGQQAVCGRSDEALVSTFCVPGSVPTTPRPNQMVEAYGRGVGNGPGKEKNKEMGGEPTRLEQALCSRVKGFENTPLLNPQNIPGR